MANTNANDPGNNKGFFITSKHSNIADSLGPQYQGLIEANPYRGLRYNKSPWQNVLHWLGFRTEADAFDENMATQAAEYDASIAQKAYDEQYNSAAMQAERMRAAGLNPDLSGGSNISPGEAASPAQDPSTPMETSGQEAELHNFASTVMSLFSSGLGIVEAIQGVRARNLNNRLTAWQTEGYIAQYAKDMFPYMLPNSPEPAGIDPNTYDWKAETLRNAERFSGKLPKSLRKAFYDHIERFWDSAPAEKDALLEFVERVKASKEYHKESSSNYSEFTSVMRDIWEPLGKLAEKNFVQALKTEGAQLTTEEAEAKETAEYLKSHDATLEGQAENKENTARGEVADYTTEIKSTINQIMTNLQSTASKGGFDGFFANVLLLLFSLNADNLLPKL